MHEADALEADGPPYAVEPNDERLPTVRAELRARLGATLARLGITPAAAAELVDAMAVFALRWRTSDRETPFGDGANAA